MLLILGVGYAALSGLSTAAAAPDRNDATYKALLQAKQALLAYAAQEYRGAGWSEVSTYRNDKPGSLPCPSRKLSTTPQRNLWGTATGNCSSLAAGGSTLVGRLPWRSLELAELKDAGGEYLWYAVSSSYASSSAYSAQPLNFETAGKIEVTGQAAAKNIVAVIIAPGAALAGQDRTGTNIDVAANYIEGAAIDDTAAALDRFFAGPADATVTQYNDALITITREELADAIEASIAMRIKRTVLPKVSDHYLHWGWLPYAQKPLTSWFDPQTVVFERTPPRTQGHLPIALDASYLIWRDESLVQIGGLGSLTGITPCASDLTGRDLTFSCERTYSGDVTYRFRARLERGAMAFISSVQLSAPGGGTPSPVTFSDGDLWIEYTGSLTSASAGPVTFALRATLSGLNPILPDDDVKWFTQNNWHRFVSYAVAEGARPGSLTTCPSDCLTVKALDSTTSPAKAVIVLAGRAVERAPGSWQARPSGTQIDYFEGLNAALPATVFEQRMRGRQFDSSDTYTGVFNDRVVSFN